MLKNSRYSSSTLIADRVECRKVGVPRKNETTKNTAGFAPQSRHDGISKFVIYLCLDKDRKYAKSGRFSGS